jgi:hypothetical protein
VGLAVEILDHPQQLATNDFLSEFLAPFPDDGTLGGLTHFDAAARERPKAVAAEAMEENGIAAQRDRGGTKIEPARADAKREHECAGARWTTTAIGR